MRVRTPLIPLVALLGVLTTALPASAYWVWTPKTGKWVNPKTQPKDSPQDQYDYAAAFYEHQDYQRAVKEFLRLVRHYPKSSQAPDAQYFAGQCYELLGQPYQAFVTYKKLVEIYPYSARFKDAIARSFAIGEAFHGGVKVRPIQPIPLAVPALDKAVEIFEHIVTQAPYGEYGDKAQFRLGQTYRKLGQYGEAMKAFEKLVQDYKLSPWVEEARYNTAFCAKQLSLKPAYDQESTDQAIVWFEEFIDSHPGSELLPEAQQSLAQLRGHKAESYFTIAEFYARQKKWLSAAFYYRQIVAHYADTPWASQAAARVMALEQAGHLPAPGAS
ncbi:MAG: outer membrane protein assembly factor BamD [Candidatus Omnitrophica bacterium]|nr:outer membrane protein assembly factor BamD [Candidatus Omnitrophota bacterium]